MPVTTGARCRFIRARIILAACFDGGGDTTRPRRLGVAHCSRLASPYAARARADDFAAHVVGDYHGLPPPSRIPTMTYSGKIKMKQFCRYFLFVSILFVDIASLRLIVRRWVFYSMMAISPRPRASGFSEILFPLHASPPAVAHFASSLSVFPWFR